jgi:hypothetical protein
LWEQVQDLLKEKVESEECAGVSRTGRVRYSMEMRELAVKEEGRRVTIWARVRSGAERLVDMAKELSYRDGSSVLQVVKRLERRALKDNALTGTLAS